MSQPEAVVSAVLAVEVTIAGGPDGSAPAEDSWGRGSILELPDLRAQGSGSLATSTCLLEAGCRAGSGLVGSGWSQGRAAGSSAGHAALWPVGVGQLEGSISDHAGVVAFVVREGILTRVLHICTIINSFLLLWKDFSLLHGVENRAR